MNFIKKNGIGILLCLAIAIPSWFSSGGRRCYCNHSRNDYHNVLE